MGKPFLTQRRLLFTPHRIDGLLWASGWEAGLEEITTAGIEPRGTKQGLFGGGIRKRLRVRTSAGGEELFVINALEEALAPREGGRSGRGPASGGAVQPDVGVAVAVG